MVNANDIVAIVLLWCKRNNVRITNARLQKFLYLIQMDYAKEHKRILISEAFCCWEFGPVIPTVYYDYHVYGADEIPVNVNPETVNKDYVIIVSKIMEKYGHLHTSELIRLCHDSEPVKYMLRMFGRDTYIPESCYINN